MMYWSVYIYLPKKSGRILFQFRFTLTLPYSKSTFRPFSLTCQNHLVGSEEQVYTIAISLIYHRIHIARDYLEKDKQIQAGKKNIVHAMR